MKMMKSKLEGDGGELIVFLHGWPDLGVLWEKQVRELKQSHRCLILTLPSYDVNDASGCSSWGYNFDELALMLAENVRQARGGEDEKAILCIHDWGSFVGFTCQSNFPELFKAIIAFDVSPAPFDRPRLKDAWKVVGIGLIYQYTLLVAYVISRLVPYVGFPIGNALTKLIAALGKRKLVNKRLDTVHVNMNYPYLYFQLNYFRELLGFGKRKIIQENPHAAPNCPCLFFYGAAKLLHFHSHTFVKNLKATPQCRVVPVQSDHWVMDANEDLINGEINTFLASL